jgi:hypothetical protein
VRELASETDFSQLTALYDKHPITFGVITAEKGIVSRVASDSSNLKTRVSSCAFRGENISLYYYNWTS